HVQTLSLLGRMKSHFVLSPPLPGVGNRSVNYDRAPLSTPSQRGRERCRGWRSKWPEQKWSEKNVLGAEKCVRVCVCVCVCVCVLCVSNTRRRGCSQSVI